ncbi:MAG: T9SS type A sorting domain-containing protein [Flavobacteriales bacterium]|nr:T9SS type A sorting domain-containing protein [Flavobacteriales bacterium]
MKQSYSLPVRTLVITGALGTVGLLVAWDQGELPTAHAYHSPAELEELRGGGIGLASGANNYFRASGDCYGCHGADNVGPVLANHNALGQDVNTLDDWRSTMMGNSARDPFWRAKVSHEVAVNPAHQSELEDKCTSCHAPMGRYDKFLSGNGHYSIGELTNDPIALDGVSCLPCHMQSADSSGLLFSGNLKFDTNNVVYGPYSEVFGAPMESFVGYAPNFGAHINDAGLCAGCHTLITETADLDGNLTGDHFVEQATYHEWLNSSFNTNADPEAGLSCQACHVPRIDDGVIISALYDFLTPRSPFGQHHFAGGNVFMLKLLKQNLDALSLTSSSTRFDSTIARTNRMLQQHTLLLETFVPDRTNDTAFIDVKLTNLAGHRFPSGYPSRRAFIELIVLNEIGDTLFQSGRWDGNYEVVGHDAQWEPHHDVITVEDQAQIYEMVMSDVNGNKTTVLERAKEPLKDNRLVPHGFSALHYTYDTTLVVNVPASDIDFNHDQVGVEGSGTDITHYHVPMGGYTGLIDVHARVWYQSVPPRWNEEMFSYNTAEIDSFRTMYEAADGTPVLVREQILTDISTEVDDIAELGVHVWPNPVRDGILRIDGIGQRVTALEVLDIRGAVVARYRPNGERNWQVILPERAGTYIVVVHARGKRFTQRVVVF